MPHDQTCPVCGSAVEEIPFTILPERGMVIANGKFAHLTTSETLLLQRMAEIFPRVLSKAAAMEWLYSLDNTKEPAIKIVDVFMCKMRKKIEPLGLRIDTLWGKGYALAVTRKPVVVTEAGPEV